jgi:uncharacterized protein (DUF849 family)
MSRPAAAADKRQSNEPDTIRFLSKRMPERGIRPELEMRGLGSGIIDPGYE